MEGIRKKQDREKDGLIRLKRIWR